MKVNILLNRFGVYFGLILVLCGQAEAGKKLILFGGGGYTPKAVAKFVDLAGGKNAKILILPWATSQPESEFYHLKEVFEAHSPSKLLRGLSPDEKSYSKAELILQIESVTGVFFPGGNQVDLMKRINFNLEIREMLLRAYHNGVVFGGYSAGTAIASKTMITGLGDFTVIDPSKVEVAEGLGLVTRFVVDQHFIARQRQNRLLSVLQKSKENLGIGIDEDTALVLEDEQRGFVLGRSYITVFQRKKSSKNFEVSLLKEGDSLIIP